jgi:hypothetical protein
MTALGCEKKLCPGDTAEANQRLTYWISHTLGGHMAFFETIVALPALIYGAISNHSEGTLTLTFGLEMFLGVIAITAVTAMAVWFTITLPLKRRAGQ